MPLETLKKWSEFEQTVLWRGKGDTGKSPPLALESTLLGAFLSEEGGRLILHKWFRDLFNFCTKSYCVFYQALSFTFCEHATGLA